MGVESAPETIMMYCKMKKFLKMNGMDFTNIDDTINEITLGNRNGFVKYKFEEELKWLRNMNKKIIHIYIIYFY